MLLNPQTTQSREQADAQPTAAEVTEKLGALRSADEYLTRTLLQGEQFLAGYTPDRRKRVALFFGNSFWASRNGRVLFSSLHNIAQDMAKQLSQPYAYGTGALPLPPVLANAPFVYSPDSPYPSSYFYQPTSANETRVQRFKTRPIQEIKAWLNREIEAGRIELKTYYI